MNGCGGCHGMGAHIRWCHVTVGPLASHLGPLSERIEGAGDQVGSNDVDLANRLYRTASALHTYALKVSTKEQPHGDQ